MFPYNDVAEDLILFLHRAARLHHEELLEPVLQGVRILHKSPFVELVVDLRLNYPLNIKYLFAICYNGVEGIACWVLVAVPDCLVQHELF